METLLGICGQDFVLVACDSSLPNSIFKMISAADKLMEVDDNKLLACVGMPGDCAQFGEYVRKNVRLSSFRSDRPLATKAMAHFTRNQLARNLRKSPFQINMLLAGYDQDGPSLYWMDYLAAMTSLKVGCHGYGGLLATSILQDAYTPNISEEEALAAVKDCAEQLKKRFIISQYRFLVKIVNKQGIRVTEVAV